jgi:S1-C subfamily serine protease
VETVFWQTIAQSRDAADFEEYLRRYPQGQFAGLARNRLSVLRAAPVDIGVPANRDGESERGRIGVAVQDLTPELAQILNTHRSNGAVIARIDPGSPAQVLGLRTGDLVVAANGTAVHNAAELRNVIRLSRAGDQVTLTIDRRGAEYNIPVRLVRSNFFGHSENTSD